MLMHVMLTVSIVLPTLQEWILSCTVLPQAR